MKSQTADSYCSFTNLYVVKAYYFQAYNVWVRGFEGDLSGKKCIRQEWRREWKRSKEIPCLIFMKKGEDSILVQSRTHTFKSLNSFRFYVFYVANNGKTTKRVQKFTKKIIFGCFMLDIKDKNRHLCACIMGIFKTSSFSERCLGLYGPRVEV